MFRRLLLVSVLMAGCSGLGMGQTSVPPDAPAPQPDAGQQPAPAAAPAASKPAAQRDPSDPASRPDWKPSEDQGYEKKGLGQRVKDEVTTAPCVHIGVGGCINKPKPKVSRTDSDDQGASNEPGPNQKPPRSDDQTRSLNADGESSSRSSIIDLSPPKDDARNHPESSAGNETAADVSEMKKWDPHRAAKDLEVGDYYFNRKNYVGAESRYQEALEYKDNFAEVMYKLGVTEEKLERPDQARKYYELYLKTLPEGDHAQECKASLARLGATSAKTQ